MPDDFQVIRGSMFGENRWLQTSTETSGSTIAAYHIYENTLSSWLYVSFSLK